MNIDPDRKKFLCEKSKTFCMFPWLHLNVSPSGNVFPCCTTDFIDPVGNTQKDSLATIFNSDLMKELRINMLADKESSICRFCYDHEKAGPFSFRTYSIENFAKFFDEDISRTNEDGSIDEFKMRYYDVRFSNICNFKCRTCGAEFSSTWAKEQKEMYFPDAPILMHADCSGTLLEEVIEQLPNVEVIYFAGGEPLLTEEHYVLLENLIRLGKKDLILRYNTNASVLSYKHYNLLDMWKHFDTIQLSCSIDHYGDRAEWLRHGTNWAQIEKNLLLFRTYDETKISFQMNTVFSVFNLPTITEFYQYLIDKHILRTGDWYNTLYIAQHPLHYSSQSLPISLKQEAFAKIKKWSAGFNTETEFQNARQQMQQAMNYAAEKNIWAEQKKEFFNLTNTLDKHRGEDFLSVFPELSPLQDLDE